MPMALGRADELRDNFAVYLVIAQISSRTNKIALNIIRNTQREKHNENFSTIIFNIN